MSDSCTCCGRPWIECRTYSGQRVSYQPGDAPCADCFEHRGFALKSDPEHIKLWAALLRRRESEHRGEVSRLQGRIAELEQQLSERPEKLVERYVDADEMQEAKSEAQRAFQSRQTAWQALCEIRLLHREVEDGMCRCGKRLDRCPVSEIVDRYPALVRWEHEQYERLQRGERHGLPSSHPAVVNPRWRPEE